MSRKASTATPADPLKLVRLQESICARKGLLACGEDFTVALRATGRILHTGADRRGQTAALSWEGVVAVHAGEQSVVALLQDGTVRTVGRSAEETAFAAGLSSVRRLAVGKHHMAALLANGQVLVGGAHRGEERGPADWQSVTDIVCGDGFTAALTASGHVRLSGASRPLRRSVASWNGIVGIFVDSRGRHLYAITEAGSLLSTAPLPAATRKWRNLIFVDAAGRHIRGVTAAGQLLSTTPLPSRYDPARVYIAVSVGKGHSAALSRDGMVVADGREDLGQCKTPRFGPLFDHFDTILSDRVSRARAIADEDRAYQVRFSEVERFASYLLTGPRLTACITAYGRVLTSSSFAAAKTWREVLAISAGNAHLIALHRDGHVSADGNNVSGCCDVSDWRDVRAVTTGNYHSLGLTWDGRVLFCGRNNKGQGDIDGWQHIRRLSTTDAYTVGVTFDGRLLLAGQPPFDPVLMQALRVGPTAISLSCTHMAALYPDGRVISTVPTTDPADASAIDPATADWHHIRAIATGEGFTLGLRYGGTVVAAGRNDFGQCETASWRHIVAIACGSTYAVGLCADGRLLTAGRFAHATVPLTNAARFRDVIAFSCAPDHLVALNRLGQIYATGEDSDAQCSATAHFALFRDAKHFYGYGKYRPTPDEDAE